VTLGAIFKIHLSEDIGMCKKFSFTFPFWEIVIYLIFSWFLFMNLLVKIPLPRSVGVIAG
jgi:hypothetical protein